jgi:DNA-binding XRE family transcriptional regulator
MIQGCREERSARGKAEVFGSLIRKLRTERRLTQEVFAERTELSVSYIGFIERGENVPTLTIGAILGSRTFVPRRMACRRRISYSKH